jgi:tetratricopeptide (TPR) repeat protein
MWYGPSGVGPLQKAIEQAQQAIRLDPDYAPAHALLSEVYYLTIWFEPVSGAIPKAREAAQTALRLDETLAEAHVSLGNILNGS